MLTEKQLQALVDCGEKEDCTGETCPMFEICDNDYTNRGAAEAAQTALAYRELAEKRRLMLKRLEWKGYDIIVEACCPICHNREEEGHEEGCELSALLKESEVEK